LVSIDLQGNHSKARCPRNETCVAAAKPTLEKDVHVFDQTDKDSNYSVLHADHTAV
jgi:hypothetical protein